VIRRVTHYDRAARPYSITIRHDASRARGCATAYRFNSAGVRVDWPGANVDLGSDQA